MISASLSLSLSRPEFPLQLELKAAHALLLGSLHIQ